MAQGIRLFLFLALVWMVFKMMADFGFELFVTAVIYLELFVG